MSGVIATIILGAVGSGLWERALSPGLDWLFRTFVDLTTSYTQAYQDKIYVSAAQGFRENFSFRVFMLISTLSALLFLFGSLILPGRPREQLAKLISSFRAWLPFVAMVCALSFSLMVSIAMGRHEAVERTVTYAVRSTDILRPYIGDHQYFLLISDFYQVRSRKEFDAFNEQVVRLAKEHGRTLPAISVCLTHSLAHPLHP